MREYGPLFRSCARRACTRPAARAGTQQWGPHVVLTLPPGYLSCRDGNSNGNDTRPTVRLRRTVRVNAAGSAQGAHFARSDRVPPCLCRPRPLRAAAAAQVRACARAQLAIHWTAKPPYYFIHHSVRSVKQVRSKCPSRDRASRLQHSWCHCQAEPSLSPVQVREYCTAGVMLP